MKEYRSKMSENGSIVVPATLCKELQINPGEELVLRVEGNALYVMSLKQAITQAQNTVIKYTKSKSLVQNLRAMRDEDAKDD